MVRSLNWNQTDVARAIPTASKTEVDQLLANLQRLTGIGVRPYDVSHDEPQWGDEAKRIHGFDAAATPTVLNVVEQYAGGDQDGVLVRLGDVVEHGEPFVIDVRYASERTTERSIRLSCGPLVEDGQTATLYGVVRDVTDTKRQEQHIEILHRTGQELRNASSKAEVAEILADAAKNVLGLVNMTVRLVDENRNMLQAIEATEECPERAGDRPNYSVNEGTSAARTYRTGEPVIHTDHEHTEDDHSWGALQSGLHVPIGSHGVLSAGDVVVDVLKEHDLKATSLLGQLDAEAITRIGQTKRSRAI